MSTVASMQRCAPIPGVLTYIFANNTSPEPVADQQKITVNVVATPRSFAWFLNTGQSGWGQLRNHNSSTAQTLQGLIECVSIIPMNAERLTLTIQSQALLNAIRADRLPSRRVAGLMRTLRERLSGFSVEVQLAVPADAEHQDRVKVLRAAERENFLPISLEGHGWMRLSSYAGIEAGPQITTADSVSESRESSIRYTAAGVIQFDQDGARITGFAVSTPRPGIVRSIIASAEKPSSRAHSKFPSPPQRLLHPKGEAAVLLGVSARSIDYLISQGRLKTVRIGKRNLVPIEELRRFARADRTEPIRHVSYRKEIA
jgi:excisionase family DNA binding protein